jgi:hypothetical protein
MEGEEQPHSPEEIDLVGDEAEACHKLPTEVTTLHLVLYLHCHYRYLSSFLRYTHRNCSFVEVHLMQLGRHHILIAFVVHPRHQSEIVRHRNP